MKTISDYLMEYKSSDLNIINYDFYTWLKFELQKDITSYNDDVVYENGIKNKLNNIKLILDNLERTQGRNK